MTKPKSVVFRHIVKGFNDPVPHVPQKVCWTCGTLPWRVNGQKCKDCGLKFEHEVIYRELPSARSPLGYHDSLGGSKMPSAKR